MATVRAWYEFDFDEVNFYDVIKYNIDYDFETFGTSETAQYNHRGSDVFYHGKSIFSYNSNIDGDLIWLAMISKTDLTYDGENINSISGTINSILAVGYEVVQGDEISDINFSFDGINILAAPFIAAINTNQKSDEKAIFQQMFNGRDTFLLSYEADTVRGYDGNDKFYGYAGRDTLYGGNGNDKLYGGAGNDKLIGGNNNDRLQGDAGNDVLNGGGGVDTIVFTGNKATTVNLGSRAAQDTGHGRDTITGVENVISGNGADTLRGNNAANTLTGKNGNDKLYGGTGNDKLIGGKNNDRLQGDAGKDILNGGVGKDILLGGAGADTFVFTNTSHSSATISRADIIKDFTGGVDKIDLSAIDASTVLAGNNIFTFDGTTPIGTSQLGDIYYKQFDKTGTVNDHTMLFVDTDNDRGREMSIKLTGLIDLSADDFIL